MLHNQTHGNMETLKNTTTYIFEKEVSIANVKTTAVIGVEYGTNKRGERFASVDQRNTANTKIDWMRRYFEDGHLDLDGMIQVIEMEGYTLTSKK